jgi:hypothetical protein
VRVEQADRDAFALVRQGRIAGERAPCARERDFLRQLAEVPRADAALLDAGPGGGEHELRGLAELRLQRGEVAPRRQLAAGIIHHAEVHPEMGRQLRAVPYPGRNWFAGNSLHVPRQRSRQGYSFLGARSPFLAFGEECRDVLRHGNEVAPQLLRQRFE